LGSLCLIFMPVLILLSLLDEMLIRRSLEANRDEQAEMWRKAARAVRNAHKADGTAENSAAFVHAFYQSTLFCGYFTYLALPKVITS